MVITIIPKATPGIYGAVEVAHVSHHATEAAVDSHHNVTWHNTMPGSVRNV